ncbi:hypothetical protein VHEMI10691 [[Torrubiella] hemipterigena]|uniref:glutathione transferase n=1 Tax=[Torrubiella] hemipterigena TaxID=1531966 RepID=A0A0A1TJE8_9HYPO|nr:hypothetical protein VHEMI10691 [[Torrubiella] hemipterigena]
MKPIKVWLTPPGPNPWKVIFLLEELGVAYEIESFRFDDVKKRPFIDINPNGRVPAIQDPNTGLTLWESGAIYQYLVKQYDQRKNLSYGTLEEKHKCNQWLHFQMSGQGPYYGQCGWFQHLHAEKVSSALERYSKEIRRILGVLEGVLAAKSTAAQWLVGDKMTFADMAFVPWNDRLTEVLMLSWEEIWDGVPHVHAWHESMTNLPSWKQVTKIRSRLMDEQNLQWNGFPKGVETFSEYETIISRSKEKTQ